MIFNSMSTTLERKFMQTHTHTNRHARMHTNNKHTQMLNLSVNMCAYTKRSRYIHTCTHTKHTCKHNTTCTCKHTHAQTQTHTPAISSSFIPIIDIASYKTTAQHDDQSKPITTHHCIRILIWVTHSLNLEITITQVGVLTRSLQ